MSKIHPVILLLAGIGIGYLGNILVDSHTGVGDIIGTGMQLFGGVLFFYSIYLLFRGKPKTDDLKSVESTEKH